MKDYRVKITIRNERLLSAIEDQKFTSVAQFCNAHKLDYARISDIIRGRLKPLDQKGKPLASVYNLLDILNINLKDAFTERQLQGFHKTSYQISMVEKDIKQLINPINNQEQKVIEQDVKLELTRAFSKRLTPREEKIIRLTYGFDGNHPHTLTEIGNILGVSKERIRQIRMKAERKLKHPCVVNEIINTGFNEVYTKVNITRDQIKKAEMSK